MDAEPSFRVVGGDSDPLEWVILRIAGPVRVRVCLPPEGWVERFLRDRPDGRLVRLSGINLWFEPISPDVF